MGLYCAAAFELSPGIHTTLYSLPTAMDKSIGRRHEAKDEDTKESESHTAASEETAAIAEPRHDKLGQGFFVVIYSIIIG